MCCLDAANATSGIQILNIFLAKWLPDGLFDEHIKHVFHTWGIVTKVATYATVFRPSFNSFFLKVTVANQCFSIISHPCRGILSFDLSCNLRCMNISRWQNLIFKSSQRTSGFFSLDKNCKTFFKLVRKEFLF